MTEVEPDWDARSRRGRHYVDPDGKAPHKCPFGPSFFHEANFLASLRSTSQALPSGRLIGIDGHGGTYKSALAEWLADEIGAIAADHDFFVVPLEQMLDAGKGTAFRPQWWRKRALELAKNSVVVVSGQCLLRTFPRDELAVYVQLFPPTPEQVPASLREYVGDYFTSTDFLKGADFEATARSHSTG